jgi:hypothetical protein
MVITLLLVCSVIVTEEKEGKVILMDGTTTKKIDGNRTICLLEYRLIMLWVGMSRSNLQYA